MLLTKWSTEDYHRLIKAGILDNRRVELLAGDIVEMTPESPLHTDAGEGLTSYLRYRLGNLAWIREAHPITLADSEPEPDVAIVHSPRSRYRQKHPHAEDIFLLIEISGSTLTKDLNEKKYLYAQACIPEYWVIAIYLQEITIFRNPKDGDYQEQHTQKEGVISPLAFPEVTINLEQLWQGEIF